MPSYQSSGSWSILVDPRSISEGARETQSGKEIIRKEKLERKRGTFYRATSKQLCACWLLIGQKKIICSILRSAAAGPQSDSSRILARERHQHRYVFLTPFSVGKFSLLVWFVFDTQLIFESCYLSIRLLIF